jgi:hypothetical protein
MEPEEKKAVVEPTTDNMTRMAQTLHDIGAQVTEMEGRAESENLEMRDKLAEAVSGVSAELSAAQQRRVLGDLASASPWDDRPMGERILHDVGPMARAEKGQPLSATDAQIIEFQKHCDTMFLFAHFAGLGPKELNEENLRNALCTDKATSSEPGRRAWKKFEKMRADVQFGATDVEFADSGWIPTMASPQMILDYNLALKVPALFPEVKMPHTPYTYPVKWARDALTYMCPGEVLADTTKFVNVLGTGLKMTFTAIKFLKASYITDEANWESIVNLTQAIYADHMDSLAWGFEYAIINGDSTATHQDTDIEALATTHAARQRKGLRKLAIAGSCKTDVNTSPWTTSVIRGNRKSMGKYGTIPSDNVMLVPPSGYIDLLSNADCKTVDVFGGQATWLTGQLASVDGHPVIISEAMRNDLDANGVNGASGNDFTAYMHVSRKMFRTGNRLGFETRYSDAALMLYGAKAFVSQMRVDFQPVLTPSTTNSTLWYGYNIAA